MDLTPTTQFWKGKRVFLTGHTGFKGSWLAAWLAQLGAEVRGFALPPETTPSLFDRIQLGERLEHTIGDLRNIAEVVGAVVDFRPEIVLHLGAQAIVRRAYREPVSTFATNLQGTVHVLEACRQTPSVRAAVIVTTDKCYDNPEWVWPFREVDRLGGHEPYSASKACAEIAVAAYRQAFFDATQSCRVATGRAGNVIGGGDWSEARLIPDAVRAAVSGQPLRVRNKDSVRPWQHVVEPLLGYLMLARALYEQTPGCPTALNFGPSPAQFAPVSRVADMFYEAWGTSPGWRYEPEANAPREARLLRLDSSLAADALGWSAKGSLEIAIGETARWYRAEAGRASAHELTTLMHEQIDLLSRGAA